VLRLHPCTRPWQVKLAQKLIPNYSDPGFVYDDLLHQYAPGAKVWADAGCGDNPDILQMPEYQGLAVGFDLDVKKSEKYLAADVYALPFKNGSIDLLTNRWVAEHLKNPEKALAEFHRTLKPGGRLLIRTTNRWHYISLFSLLAPMRLKRVMSEVNIFPTYYRFNDDSAYSSFFGKHPEWRMERIIYSENLQYQNPAGFVFSVITEGFLSAIGLGKFKTTIILNMVRV
jgi:SAM-dependent methyltransferase